MKHNGWRTLEKICGYCVFFVVAAIGIILLSGETKAGTPWLFGGRWTGWGFEGREHLEGPQAMAGTWYKFPGSGTHGGCCSSCCGGNGDGSEVGGSWFWMRSPEEERVVTAAIFNRYCIRCHGVDGRGVWDIPGVPDFTNPRWQASRSDDQIARIIIEGRGAVMPTFRGTLNLEQAWAMARYLRTFVPGSEISKPDMGSAEKLGVPTQAPANPPAKK